MKLQLCHYSGYKIHPGHGKTMVRIDGKTFIFSQWKMRKHKKGVEEELTKKRTRRTQKYQRAIVGASLTDIMAKRNMKPEVRKAQREQAIRAAKEKKAAKTQKKVQHAPPKSKSKTHQKIAKPMPKSARPGHGGRR
ncbi:60S ribosomal protein L24 [Armadillidium vulgare]|nr:60S ribosomal protein L24 [Armadillidium vulgare]